MYIHYVTVDEKKSDMENNSFVKYLPLTLAFRPFCIRRPSFGGAIDIFTGYQI